jgi:hypothetical protein
MGQRLKGDFFRIAAAIYEETEKLPLCSRLKAQGTS